MKQKKLLPVILLIICVALPLLFNDSYISSVFTMMGIYAIFAAGMNVVSGYAGIMSYGRAAFLGLGGYAGAMLYQDVGLPLIVVFLLVMVLCAIVGAFIGLLTLRLHSIYFSITMMGVAGIFRTIATNWESLTNGPRGMVVNPVRIPAFLSSLNYETILFYITLVVLVISLYMTNQLTKTFTGRSLVALRDGENLAMSLGINTKVQKIYAFILSAIISGFAGFLYGFNFRIIVPDLMNTNYTIIGLLIIMIGGKGKLYAPVVGAIVYTGFYEVLRSIGEVRMVIYAALLLAVVLLMPQGLIGKATEIWQAYKMRKTVMKGDIADA